MRVIICGDRNWNDMTTMAAIMSLFPTDTIIIQGGCNGADNMAAKIGCVKGFRVETYPADWKKHGPSAGPIRNANMLKRDPERVIAFHNDVTHSRGTMNMIIQALRKGVRVTLVTSAWMGDVLSEQQLTQLPPVVIE